MKCALHGLAIFFLGLGCLRANLPAWSESAMSAWWKAHPAGSDWAAESARLKKILLEGQEKSGLAQAVISDSFVGWLQLAVWLECFPGDGEAWLRSADGQKAFASVGANAVLRNLFLSSLSPYDDAPKACEILCRALHEHPEEVRKLPQVAVAIALVFDQPFPDNWPHPWVKKEALALGDDDPVRRFHWYYLAREQKKFLVDPTRLEVRDLMFVIDTPLALSELEYTLQVNLKDGGRLADLFKQVPYDFKRMEAGQLDWPHGGYKLIDVGRKGGICADQAFFVSETGKSQGIPTVMLMGQGSSGGHAWVGFMGSPGSWTLNVARYQEGNFVSGSAWDPQTWRRVTDAQLRFLFKEPAKGIGVLRSRLLSRWALMNKAAEWYPLMLGQARSAWLRSFDTWELQAACLEEKNIPDAQRKVFWDQWITTFQVDPDMRFRGQSKLLELYQRAGDTAAVEGLRAKITSENKSKRFDLAISLAVGPVFDLVEAGKWEDADLQYSAVLKQFQKQAGGDLFYNLVWPYVEKSLHAGRRKEAQAAFYAAKPLFTITPASTMEIDVKALEQMVK